MRSTSAISTPIPTINFPSAPVFGRAAPSDYTGRVVSATKTLKSKRSARVSRDPVRALDGWTEHAARGLRILQVSALSKIPWLVHGFSTRPSGVSPLKGEKVLNLGFAQWDSKE